jgi:hypothetical protein
LSYVRVKELQKQDVLTRAEKENIICDFERKNASIKYCLCQCCRTVQLDNEIKGPQKRCQKCRRNKYTFESLLEKRALPIWRKKGKIMFHVPGVLSSLSIAEKALIQRLSPFISLTHMSRGIMGMTGHTCVFEQDINGFIDTLPRRIDDITFLNVIKKIKREIGGNLTYDQILRVNKMKVFRALVFLKEHSTEYKNINIDMNNLSWMKGETDVLDKYISDSVTDNENMNVNEAFDDIGPCPTQANDPNNTGEENIGHFGCVNEKGTPHLSNKDRIINNTLQNQLKGKKSCILNWPSVSDTPVNEYSDTRIFAMAFPWLFPGGEGDIKDYPGDMAEWGKNMLFYEDGRFDNDEYFSFFAMNYIIRHRNNKSSGFFVKAFSKGCPRSLQELQQQIRNGNMSFINSLTYYNKRVKGSSSYWRAKRSELYTWINYHVEKGNGVPMFFITLSCAEYYWYDIIRLLKQRIELAGKDSSQCYVGSKQMSTIIKQYTSVIQEYFQQRVVTWLDTVGKQIFGIKHYWVRYEFAPGRGQIHAHLLAISKDQSIYKLCHNDLKFSDGKERRANRLADFVQQHYDMTANVDPNFDSITIEQGRNALSMRFMDVNDHQNDIQYLLKTVMEHKCSGFCMRTNKKRYVFNRAFCISYNLKSRMNIIFNRVFVFVFLFLVNKKDVSVELVQGKKKQLENVTLQVIL